MSSDSIHDAVLCAERRGRTPARSIDAAILDHQHTAATADQLMVNLLNLRLSSETRLTQPPLQFFIFRKLD